MMYGRQVHASLATIPRRAHILQDVVETILPQVDVLHIAFNYGARPVPSWAIENPKIEYAVYDNRRGDAAKFDTVRGAEGYIVICDDDVFYPRDFVKKMVKKAKRCRGVATIAGSNIPGMIESYYYGRDKVATAFTGTQIKQDQRVHIGATGGWAYDSDVITFPAEVFQQPNMADIYASAHCNTQGVPIVCIAKRKGWIREAERDSNSIYATRAEHDHEQAAVCNSVRWKSW